MAMATATATVTINLIQQRGSAEEPVKKNEKQRSAKTEVGLEMKLRLTKEEPDKTADAAGTSLSILSKTSSS